MKTITLAHSELTGTIYAIIGREKVDITDQAIAEVKAIKALEQETVSKEVYDNEHFARKEAEQKLWELQQNISDDCVSRQAVIEYIKDCNAELMHDIENEAVREDILDMPPVTPKIPTSDDCVSRKQAIATIGTDIQLNLEGKSGLLKYSDEIKDILKALLDNQEKKLKALPPVTPKQEPKADVLDKIRAEMIEIQLIGYATVDGKRVIARKAVLQIIDKYRAESEE